MKGEVRLFVALSLIGMSTLSVVLYFAQRAWSGGIYVIGTVAMFIPLVSAVVAIKVSGESLDAYNVKPKMAFKPLHVLIALVMPFVIAYLAALLASPFFRIDLTASGLFRDVASQLEKYGVSLTSGQIVAIVVINYLTGSLINTIFAYGEEAGWRGYLWPKLREEYGYRAAVVYVGVIWGVWHWPLILAANAATGNITVDLLIVLPTFVAFTIGLSAFLIWMVESSNSVLYPALAHGAINAGLGIVRYLILTESGVVSSPGGIATAAASLLVGLIFYLQLEKGVDSRGITSTAPASSPWSSTA